MIDLIAIRARDEDDYATAEVLRNIQWAGNTDPELTATINMVADRRALLECVESLAAAARAVSAASDALIVMGDGRAYFDSGAATHEFRAALAALRARLEQMSHD